MPDGHSALTALREQVFDVALLDLSMPGLDGLGTLAQGFLEISNVSIVNELVDMIAAQRAYELNSKAVRASDEMMERVNNLVR